MTRTTKWSEVFASAGLPARRTAYGRARVPEQRGHPPAAGERADAAGAVNGSPYQVLQHTGSAPWRRGGSEKVAALALIVFLIVTAASVGYGLLQPKVYGATAEFVLAPRTDMTDAAVDRAMETQLLVTESRPVLDPVAQRVGMPVVELQEAISAEMIGRSNILRLTVRDRDQARAVQLVQLITEQYLRTAPVTGPTAAAGADQSPPTRVTLLSGPSPMARPMQPRPKQALAVGMLLGVIAGLAVVTLVVRPRFLFRPSAYWQ